nr:MAG TPA_asm: hypothetical protein [Caudoviricetes sp.]
MTSNPMLVFFFHWTVHGASTSVVQGSNPRWWTIKHYNIRLLKATIRRPFICS